MKRVYAFAGPEGGGKTTAANMVRDIVGWEQSIVIGFAEPLKHMLLSLGVPYRNVYGTQAEKEEPLDILCGKSARYALQTLGTEWGRKLIGDDIWAKAWEQRVGLSPAEVVIADDLRFSNEIAAVERNAGMTMTVSRHQDQWEPDAGHHPSQRFYDLQTGVAIVAENRAALKEAVQELLKD